MSGSQDELKDEGTRPAGPVEAGDPPPAAEQQGVPPTTPPTGEAVEQDFDELLAAAHKERDEYLELAKRTKADFENYRKRMSQEVQASGARAKAALAGELVHVVDNLERALEAGDENDPLVQGIHLTKRDLYMAMNNHGVEAFDPVGERFDPTWHQALTTKPSQDHEPGIVLSTERKGYRLGDQLIRPALVIVSE